MLAASCTLSLYNTIAQKPVAILVPFFFSTNSAYNSLIDCLITLLNSLCFTPSSSLSKWHSLPG